MRASAAGEGAHDGRAGAVRVYQYGLLAPTENASVVRDMLLRAWKYRVALRTIEIMRRAAIRPILSAHGKVPALEEAVRAAAERATNAARAIKAARQDTRSRSDTAPMREACRAAKEVLREARAALFAARRALREDPEIRALQDAVGEKAGELRRSARSFSGMARRGPYCGAFGSYLLVEAAADTATKAPLYDGAEPNDPRRVPPFNGEGSLGVQIRGGIPSTDVFGSDRYLRIAPVDARAWSSESRSERRRRSRTVLRMRMCTGEGGEPVWASWPMLMHRPLPEGSVITRASVTVRKIGPRERWLLDVTVRTPESAPLPVGQRKPRGQTGMVVVDFGWRVIDGGMRVAYWRSSDGECDELRLDAQMVSDLAWPDGLRGTRDGNFNKARAALVEWLRGRDVPEWLQKQTAGLVHWRDPTRLCKVAEVWKGSRFEGDADGYQPLERWRYQDFHLWQWECSQRSKALAHRRELYRIFSRDLATRFRTVVVEDWDLREVARLPEPDSEDNVIQRARTQRQRACVSELRNCLLEAFGAPGMPTKGPKCGDWDTTIVVDPAGSTHLCHACGSVGEFDAAVELIHACEVCGAVWDQDDNASRVLLARGNELLAVRTDGTGTRARETKWQRVARRRREKVARMKSGSDPREEPVD